MATALTTTSESQRIYTLTPDQIKVISNTAQLPREYTKNEGNLLLAYEFAQRKGHALMDVVQNMHFINGRPSWSAEYQRAALNRSGYIIPPMRYSFERDEKGNAYSCTAYVKLASTGEVIEGDKVTLQMAAADGWTKNPKWNSMPEIMLKNRATTFLIRYNFPEVLDGMMSTDEAEDIAAMNNVAPMQYEDKTNVATTEDAYGKTNAALAKANDAVQNLNRTLTPKQKLYNLAMVATHRDKDKAVEFCAKALNEEGITSDMLTEDNYTEVSKHFVEYSLNPENDTASDTENDLTEASF